MISAIFTEVVLQHLLYFVLGIAAIFYVALDGFDLGVGILHLFIKGDKNRRILINSIGPVWDGNEVWLVIIGGVLLAAFSPVYAAILSGFYTPVMLLLLGLIFRVCAIEFRSKSESKFWRQAWDVIFTLSSVALSFILGTTLGNLVVGVPLGQNREFESTVIEFFNPYSMLVGLTAIFLFASHGAIYLMMKIDDELIDKVKPLFKRFMIVFLLLYLALSLVTIKFYPYMIDKMSSFPFLFILPLLGFISLFSTFYLTNKQYFGFAFITSALGMAFLLAVFGLGTYPVMVKSTLDPHYSLTLYNASSSKKTLGILTIIVAIGVPTVIAYGTFIYHTFRGKVKLDKHSY